MIQYMREMDFSSSFTSPGSCMPRQKMQPKARSAWKVDRIRAYLFFFCKFSSGTETVDFQWGE